MNGSTMYDPDRQTRMLADIYVYHPAKEAQRQAEQSATLREARELIVRTQRQADQDREQARMRQEEANQVAAQAAREVEQMRKRMEEVMNTTIRALELSNATANAAIEEAARIMREAQEERKRLQRMYEEVERVMAGVREEAVEAKRVVNEQRREADVSKAPGERHPRIATKRAQNAMEAGEAAERLKREIQYIVTPTPGEPTGAKRRMTCENAMEAEEAAERLKREIQHVMTPTPGEPTATKRRMMHEYTEKAMAVGKKEAGRAYQAPDEQHREPKVGKAPVEWLPRIASKEAHNTMKVEEAERYSKGEIQRIVTPSPEEIAGAKERMIREDAEKMMVAIKEETERVQQAANEQRRQAEASKAEAEEAARAAATEVQKAKEAEEEAEKRLKEGIRPVVAPTPEQLAATKRRIQYKEGCFHFAVAGVSGSGKSSLVNAFRGLRAKDVGAAPVGVTERTLEMSRYPDTNLKHPFVWYSIPGAGTFKSSDWQYFNDQGLYVFDCIIVLLDNRFTRTDVAILVNARRFNIPTYIVRSKSDQHIRNAMREMGYDSEGSDEEEVERRKKLYKAARKQFIEETRKSVKTNLEDANLPADQRVYIVSDIAMVLTVQHKTPRMAIDEVDLVNDLFNQGYSAKPGA